MSSVDAIIDHETCSTWLGLQTQASKTCLSQQLNEWTSNKEKLLQLSAKYKRFKAVLEKDSTFFTTTSELFREIAEIETQLHTLMDRDSAL